MAPPRREEARCFRGGRCRAHVETTGGPQGPEIGVDQENSWRVGTPSGRNHQIGCIEDDTPGAPGRREVARDESRHGRGSEPTNARRRRAVGLVGVPLVPPNRVGSGAELAGRALCRETSPTAPPDRSHGRQPHARSAARTRGSIGRGAGSRGGRRRLADLPAGAPRPSARACRHRGDASGRRRRRRPRAGRTDRRDQRGLRVPVSPARRSRGTRPHPGAGLSALRASRRARRFGDGERSAARARRRRPLAHRPRCARGITRDAQPRAGHRARPGDRVGRGVRRLFVRCGSAAWRARRSRSGTVALRTRRPLEAPGPAAAETERDLGRRTDCATGRSARASRVRRRRVPLGLAAARRGGARAVGATRRHRQRAAREDRR